MKRKIAVVRLQDLHFSPIQTLLTNVCWRVDQNKMTHFKIGFCFYSFITFICNNIFSSSYFFNIQVCSDYNYCTTYILLYVLGIFYVCFLLWNISPLAVSAQFLDEQVELLSDIQNTFCQQIIQSSFESFGLELQCFQNCKQEMLVIYV